MRGAPTRFGLPYPGLSPMLSTSMASGLAPGLTPGGGPFSTTNHIGAFQPKSTHVPTLDGSTPAPPNVDPRNPAADLVRSRWAVFNPPTAGRGNPRPSQPPDKKKPGKWCAAHVRIAWEIYHHQQRQQAEAQKDHQAKADLLRAPSHLLPGLHRPPDLSSTLLGPSFSAAAAVAAAAAAQNRSPFDTMAGLHSPFLNPAAAAPPGHLSSLGMSPFVRPGLYGNFGPPVSAAYPFGGLAGMFGREIPNVPGLGAAPSSEWNRLRRTPPSFPQPPSWLKAEAERDVERKKEETREREADKERENERLRERERTREKTEQEKRDREIREQRLAAAHGKSSSSPSATPKLESYRNSDPVERVKESERMIRSSSNSNSPPRLVDEQRKAESSVESSHSNKSAVRVKEERKDEPSDLRVSQPAGINAKLTSDYLPRDVSASLPPPIGLNPLLIDRNRMLGAPPYGLPPDRLGRHPLAMWDAMRDPYRNPLDFQQHRVDFQHELEREREQMLRRLHAANPLAPMIDHERFRDREPHAYERERRELEARREMDKIVMERERVAAAAELERGRVPPVRPSENNISYPSIMCMYPRVASPVTNHKNSSPQSTVGIPPPLIPTNGNNHSHTNSPVVNSKGSPIVENSIPHEHLKKDSIKSNDVGTVQNSG